MNVSAHIFLNRARRRLGAAAALGVAAAASLSGCAGNPFAEGPVDPGSTIAADVAREARVTRPYPTFAQIPTPPTDVRRPRAFGAAASEVEAAGDQLARDTGPGAWTLDATGTFAARAERELGDDPGPTTQSDPEAFARKLRERATPPPPPR